MPERLDNDAFFAAKPNEPARDVQEDRFYRNHARPPASPSFLVKAAEHPLRFGLILFGVGWAGILIQAGFFQQVVLGAPLFEEPAKVGGALALAALIRARSLWLRLPLAAAFGAGFGVFEHFVTYSEEDVSTWVVRVAFHGVSTVMSMAAFTALEVDADVRLRWGATLPSTLLHYVNNFGALVLGVASIAAPWLDTVALGWAVFVILLLSLATLAVLARPEAFRKGAMDLAKRFVPALRSPP